MVARPSGPEEGALKRATLVVAGVVGFVGLCALIGVVHPLDANWRPPPPAKATAPPPPAAPAVSKDDLRQFRRICEAEVQAGLTDPATFTPHMFLAGEPTPVTWPDHTTSLRWAFDFDASNAYGAVGHYTATCGQKPDGTVTSSIAIATAD
ncbi:MAG: hypothetical protein ACHP7N_11300 [Caulobacterales bacterium]